jgi:hypothetical protein
MKFEYTVEFVFDNAMLGVVVLTDVPADAYAMAKDEDAVINAAVAQFEREVGLVIPTGKPCIEINITLTNIIP